MSGWSQLFLDWLLGAMASWGYLIVFCLTVFESIFVVGSFMPGELVIAAASFTASQRTGSLDPTLVFLCAVVGAMVGTNISYLIGVRGGRSLIERVGPRFGMGEDTIEAAERYFEKHGTRTMFLARWIAVFKNVTPVLAGASRMRLPAFEGYVLAGISLNAAVLTAIGWYLGENFTAGLKWLTALGWVGFVLVIAGFAFIAWGKSRFTRKQIAKLSHEEDPEDADASQD